MRTISAPLAAALAASPRQGAECLVIAARDGARARFTTRDTALTIDLGLGAGAESCSAGMTLSALTWADGLDASSCEVTGPFGATVTRAGVLGGRWRHAQAWLVWVSPGVAGIVPLLAGRVAENRVEAGAWVFEVRNAADALNQTIGRVLSPYCTANFGDVQCGVVRVAYPCTVTAVAAGAAGRFRFTTSLGGAHPDDFFNLGEVAFLTGALAGTAPVEVFDSTGASGAVELYAPLVAAPVVGDTLNLFRGCSKLMISATVGLPTCVSYANGPRHRGFPDVPGSDLYLKISPPGAAGA